MLPCTNLGGLDGPQPRLAVKGHVAADLKALHELGARLGGALGDAVVQVDALDCAGRCTAQSLLGGTCVESL